MMTSAPVDLLGEGGADLRDLPADLDLIGLLRAADRDHPCGQSWTFYLDASDHRAPTLSVGLRGQLGTLSWWDGTTQFVSTMVVQTGNHIDYVNGGFHHQVDAGEEIPSDYVFAALAEFVATRTRPTCIRWRPVA
jgi:Immunity protein Imm1